MAHTVPFLLLSSDPTIAAIRYKLSYYGLQADVRMMYSEECIKVILDNVNVYLKSFIRCMAKQKRRYKISCPILTRKNDIVEKTKEAESDTYEREKIFIDYPMRAWELTNFRCVSPDIIQMFEENKLKEGKERVEPELESHGQKEAVSSENLHKSGTLSKEKTGIVDVSEEKFEASWNISDHLNVYKSKSSLDNVDNIKDRDLSRSNKTSMSSDLKFNICTLSPENVQKLKKKNLNVESDRARPEFLMPEYKNPDQFKDESSRTEENMGIVDVSDDENLPSCSYDWKAKESKVTFSETLDQDKEVDVKNEPKKKKIYKRKKKLNKIELERDKTKKIKILKKIRKDNNESNDIFQKASEQKETTERLREIAKGNESKNKKDQSSCVESIPCEMVYASKPFDVGDLLMLLRSNPHIIPKRNIYNTLVKKALKKRIRTRNIPSGFKL